MTFSIVAKSKRSIGVGVASGSIAVGSRVPWAKYGVGAIATQGYTETRYGREGLKLLEKGLDPNSALQKLLREDSNRERRQVAFLDGLGRKAVHTGRACPRKSGSIVGKDFICLGNTLKNERAVMEMASAFEAERVLPWRILRALKAGSDSGGDMRGEISAALLMRGQEDLDLRVDEDRGPIEKLMRKFEESSSKKLPAN